MTPMDITRARDLRAVFGEPWFRRELPHGRRVDPVRRPTTLGAALAAAYRVTRAAALRTIRRIP